MGDPAGGRVPAEVAAGELRAVEASGLGVLGGLLPRGAVVLTILSSSATESSSVLSVQPKRWTP
jgi:hypothetical protein